MEGIYALDGDTLIICDNAEDLEKPRKAAVGARQGCLGAIQGPEVAVVHPNRA